MPGIWTEIFPADFSVSEVQKIVYNTKIWQRKDVAELGKWPDPIPIKPKKGLN